MAKASSPKKLEALPLHGGGTYDNFVIHHRCTKKISVTSFRRWNEQMVQLEKGGDTPPAALTAHMTERKKEDHAIS
jgi:hypothetical protein